jgi:hypothetical protein
VLVRQLPLELLPPLEQQQPVPLEPLPFLEPQEPA